MQVGYHYLSGIIKLKKLDSHSLNILAATFYEHYERMDKKRHQMIFQMMSLLHSIRVIPLGSFVIRLESFYELLCLDVIKYVSMC